MTNQKLFLTVLLRSVARRRSKSVIAVLAIALVATLVAVMLSLSVGVRANLSTEIRRFGANIVLYPQADDGLLDDSVGPRVEKGALGSRIYASAPFLHQPAVVSGKPFDLVGTDFADALKVSPYWRVTGSAPTKGQVAVGADVAAALKLEPGSSIDVRIAKPASSGKGSGACR